MFKLLAKTTLATLLAAPLWAQDHVFDDDVIAQGRLCVGTTCADGEPFGGLPSDGLVKIKGIVPSLLFEDTSTLAGAPTTDWRLWSGNSFDDAFFLENIDDGTKPLSIDGDAPSNSFFIGTNGEIGLGTMFPLRDLHIRKLGSPGIRLDQVGQGAPPYQWEITGNDLGFSVIDFTEGYTPLFVGSGAGANAVHVASGGFVGLGTNAPEGKLHTRGNGVQLAYFESGDGDAVQVRFRTDSENRRFLATDNADNVKTQMQFRDDAILFLGQTVAQEWLRVDATGITTAGPTCGTPCDLTFDPEAFTVPPIEERAAYMWENRHLPAVGPTSPEQPFNLTEKTAGMLHELEVAHIYIDQLNSELATERARITRLEAQMTALLSSQKSGNDNQGDFQ